jgi:hypothetical protein
MSYYSIGSDLPLWDKKMKAGGDSRNLGFVCFDEQAAHAQIPNWGYVLTPGRTPVHIDFL